MTTWWDVRSIVLCQLFKSIQLKRSSFLVFSIIFLFRWCIFKRLNPWGKIHLGLWNIQGQYEADSIVTIYPIQNLKMCEIHQLLSGLWWPGDPGLQPKKISLAWKFILHYLFAIKVPLLIYVCSSRFCVWLNTDANEGRVNHFCVIAVSLVGAVSWSLLFFLVVAWSQEILYPGYSQCPKKELPSNFENRETVHV